MAKLRVFISHSSGEETEFLDRVCEMLEERHGFEILVDRRNVRAADEWRNRIIAMVAECHAAVILFSQRALTSRWVHFEAAALSWRRALEEDFRLVIIRFPGVSEQVLQNGRFEPLALGELQQREVGEPEQVASAVAEALENRVPFDTKIDMADRAITALLRKVDLDDDGFEKVCEAHFGPSRWHPMGDRRAILARELSRMVLRDGAGKLIGAMKILDSLNPGLTKDTASRILEILEPFWVEPAAAGMIPLIALRRGRSRDAALNGHYFAELTADLYLRRAYPLSNQRQVVWVDDGSDGDFAEYVAERVRADIRIREWRFQAWPDEEVDRFVNDKRGLPLFIMVPRLPPDIASLEELRDLYPRATFVFCTGPSLPGPEVLYAGIKGLEPELVVEEEFAAMHARLQADIFLGNLPD